MNLGPLTGSLRREGIDLVLTLEGRLDGDTANRLSEYLRGLEAWDRRIVLDLSAVSLPDPVALRRVLNAHRNGSGDGGSLILRLRADRSAPTSSTGASADAWA